MNGRSPPSVPPSAPPDPLLELLLLEPELGPLPELVVLVVSPPVPVPPPVPASPHAHALS
jgi:hypothetical protein